MPAASLPAWLATSKKSFLSGPADSQQAAIASIGNIAGDLDSIVSAVCLAFLEAAQPQAPVVAPLLPFDREDFRLRQDADLLFRHCGLGFDSAGAVEDLIYLDEVAAPGEAWRRGSAALGVALVDHNRIAPGVAALLGDRVVAIVDHHADESAHLEAAESGEGCGALDAVRRVRLVDAAAGSACSLVANLFHEQLGDAPSELCVLLLATIAVDTRGFDAKARATPELSRAHRPSTLLASRACGSCPTRTGKAPCRPPPRSTPPPGAQVLGGRRPRSPAPPLGPLRPSCGHAAFARRRLRRGPAAGREPPDRSAAARRGRRWRGDCGGAEC